MKFGPVGFFLTVKNIKLHIVNSIKHVCSQLLDFVTLSIYSFIWNVHG